MPRKNDPRFVINSRWTALAPVLNWRHFRVVDRRWDAGELQVEIMAVCDRAARVWVGARELLDKERFVSGWRDPPAENSAPQ